MIEVKNLTAFYEKSERTIFDDISFKLTNDSLFALCGKNGSGKSTLLLLMAGDCPEEQNTALLTLVLYLFL